MIRNTIGALINLSGLGFLPPAPTVVFQASLPLYLPNYDLVRAFKRKREAPPAGQSSAIRILVHHFANALDLTFYTNTCLTMRDHCSSPCHVQRVGDPLRSKSTCPPPAIAAPMGIPDMGKSIVYWRRAPTLTYTGRGRLTFGKDQSAISFDAAACAVYPSSLHRMLN